MNEIILLRPTKQYAKQVMAFREEMLQNNESFDGCAGLENMQSFDEWINFETRKMIMLSASLIFDTHYQIFSLTSEAISDIVFVRQKGEKVMRLKCLD